jgi:hypothetical protein
MVTDQQDLAEGYVLTPWGLIRPVGIFNGRPPVFIEVVCEFGRVTRV